MTRFLLNRPVVVGVDDSEFSLKALEWAARYAGQCKCPLQIIHVARDRGSETEQLRAKVDDRLARTTSSPRWIIWRVRHGKPAEVLVEEAVSARLLVLGHREPRPIIGSTLRGVLAHGISHVAVIAETWSADVTYARKIVVGVRDPGSRPALELALGLANTQRCALTVVHATHRPTPTTDRTIADETHRVEAAARSMLSAMVQDAEREYPDAEVSLHVIQGDPSTVLLAAAADVDLLIIGGRPASGSALSIGSTVEDILKHSDRPVIITRTGHRSLPLLHRFQLRRRLRRHAPDPRPDDQAARR